jgi:hypothetical protein
VRTAVVGLDDCDCIGVCAVVAAASREENSALKRGKVYRAQTWPARSQTSLVHKFSLSSAAGPHGASSIRSAEQDAARAHLSARVEEDANKCYWVRARSTLGCGCDEMRRA